VTIVGALKLTNAVSVALASLHTETDAANNEEDQEALSSKNLVSVTDTES
jgi:hypothetical protein